LLRQLQLSSYRFWTQTGSSIIKDNHHATSQAFLEFEIFAVFDRSAQPGELGLFRTRAAFAADSSSIVPRRFGLPCLRTAIGRKP
jgi:hypothetical protein